MSKKYKIFMLSDDPRSSSGVGTQSRWLIQGLLATNKYSFRCFGAAVKHEDYRTQVINDDFIIRPTDGFGKIEDIRQVLITEKPDAMLLFTDPRFFQHVWFMEDEIHQICPICFNTIWDNFPTPQFNKTIYDVCDLNNCINQVAYSFVREWFPQKTNYIPHAVPRELYKVISQEEKLQWRQKLLGNNRADHFVALYVGRNARRKCVSDIIASWSEFMSQIKTKYNTDKATLLLHCNPLDQEGPNLYEVCNTFGVKDSIVFSKDLIEFNIMNVLYNIADIQLNNSCFIAGTKVVTNKGFKNIEDVCIGDKVLTHKSRWRDVINLIRNPIEEKNIRTLKITNMNPITCTTNHKFNVIKKSSLPKKFFFNEEGMGALQYIKPCQAEYIEVGDYVASFYEKHCEPQEYKTFDMFSLVCDKQHKCGRYETMINTFILENNRVLSRTYGYTDHGPRYVQIDENMAYVLGVWAADGTTHNTDVSFNIKDQSKVQLYAEKLKLAFPGMDCTINHNPQHHTSQVVHKNGCVVALFFTELCGFYSSGKHVPDLIKNSKLSVKKAFIEGYQSGDGCKLLHKQYSSITNRIRTISHAMAQDLRQLLIDLNYTPNLYYASNAHGFNKQGMIWTLEWRDRKNGDNGSCRSWNLGDGVIISRVHTIEDKTYNQQVYNLTVDEDHTYMVEGTTVFNCAEGFGLPILEGKMVGLPAIALKTGGLTRQIKDHITGEQYGVAIEPEVKTCVGNQMIPYIYEDYCSNTTYTNAIMKMYELPKDDMQLLRQKCIEHTNRDYKIENLISEWDRTLEHTINTWRDSYKPWQHIEL